MNWCMIGLAGLYLKSIFKSQIATYEQGRYSGIHAAPSFFPGSIAKTIPPLWLKSTRKYSKRTISVIPTPSHDLDPSIVLSFWRIYNKPLIRSEVVELENEFNQSNDPSEIGGKIWARLGKATSKPFIYYNQVVSSAMWPCGGHGQVENWSQLRHIVTRRIALRQ